ncbi:MAG: arylmalonate decarboxylase [Gammaproteobacteria bacterium]|nr:arylmalonate decarboxylase [Gammaproteobacteria bacterium]MDH3447075.1 arylmalonate decarboxylase [Gammaproteobacteria bacterium]
MSRSSVLAPTPRDIRFDAGRHPRAKIGYVLLATEQTVQDDVMTLRPPGVGIHFTRAAIPDSITSESLAAQADLLADCAATLLPDGSLDVVCYACTSGSLVIGEERVFAELKRGAPNAVATSLISGVIRALQAVHAHRIVVATPYLDEVNQREVEYLEQEGFEVVSMCGLNLEKDSDMVRVAPDYIAEFALAQDRIDADAIFISCGALRTLDVIGRIEAQAGKPAICSNQAMVWDCLRLAGIEDRFSGYGRLLADY